MTARVNAVIRSEMCLRLLFLVALTGPVVSCADAVKAPSGSTNAVSASSQVPETTISSGTIEGAEPLIPGRTPATVRAFLERNPEMRLLDASDVRERVGILIEMRKPLSKETRTVMPSRTSPQGLWTAR